MTVSEIALNKDFTPKPGKMNPIVYLQVLFLPFPPSPHPPKSCFYFSSRYFTWQWFFLSQVEGGQLQRPRMSMKIAPCSSFWSPNPPCPSPPVFPLDRMAVVQNLPQGTDRTAGTPPRMARFHEILLAWNLKCPGGLLKSTIALVLFLWDTAGSFSLWDHY